MSSSATESSLEGGIMKNRTRIRFVVVAWLAALTAAGCVNSELEAPANHPAHAAARSGDVRLSTALHSEHDVQTASADEGGLPHAEHDGHESHGTAATHVCPMHPEVVGKEGDKCSICGMKLVPKKGDK